MERVVPFRPLNGAIARASGISRAGLAVILIICFVAPRAVGQNNGRLAKLRSNLQTAVSMGESGKLESLENPKKYDSYGDQWYLNFALVSGKSGDQFCLLENKPSLHLNCMIDREGGDDPGALFDLVSQTVSSMPGISRTQQIKSTTAWTETFRSSGGSTIELFRTLDLGRESQATWIAISPPATKVESVAATEPAQPSVDSIDDALVTVRMTMGTAHYQNVTLSYSAIKKRSDGPWTVSSTSSAGLVLDSSGCDATIVEPPSPGATADRWSLRDGMDIAVLPIQQSHQAFALFNGNEQAVLTGSSPQITVVELRAHTGNGDRYGTFLFTDATRATSAANALRRVVDYCKGSRGDYIDANLQKRIDDALKKANKPQGIGWGQLLSQAAKMELDPVGYQQEQDTARWNANQANGHYGFCTATVRIGGTWTTYFSTVFKDYEGDMLRIWRQGSSGNVAAFRDYVNTRALPNGTPLDQVDYRCQWFFSSGDGSDDGGNQANIMQHEIAKDDKDKGYNTEYVGWTPAGSN